MHALHPVRPFWRALALRAMLAAVLAGAGVSAPFAQTGSVPLIVLRPEIATPLQAAQELVRASKFDEALARIREAEAVPDRTPGEILAIDRMRGVAASGAGDIPTATRSFEAVVAAGGLEPADRARLTQALALLYFQGKDFPKAATWAARYLQENGTHADMRWLLIRAQYLADDWASAARELRADVDAGVRSGAAPPLERLQLLANCYTKLGDNAGYVYALEALLAFYPKKEYWADAIRRVEAKPGFADRLALDALRLRQATGVLSAGADYAAMAELALAAGLPAEAKRIADQGLASGALGTGADADKQKRVRDTAAKQVAEDQRAAAAKRQGRRGRARRHRARQRRLRLRERRSVRPGHRADGAGHAEGRLEQARRREAAPGNRLSRGGAEGQGHRGFPRRRRHRRHGGSRAPMVDPRAAALGACRLSRNGADGRCAIC